MESLLEKTPERSSLSMAVLYSSLLHERLSSMVEHALPGTLIPVDSIRDLLAEEASSHVATAPGVSLDEVARRCAPLVRGGKAVQLPAVRRWIRVGLRGVRLTAFEWGLTYRVHETDLESFIEALTNAPARRERRRVSVADRTGILAEIGETRHRFRGAARR
jgi:hypothetical protein